MLIVTLMSATTELLLEQIKQTETAIMAAAEMGHDTTSMQHDLRHLRQKLALCNNALNEGKGLLKS